MKYKERGIKWGVARLAVRRNDGKRGIKWRAEALRAGKVPEKRAFHFKLDLRGVSGSLC